MAATTQGASGPPQHRIRRGRKHMESMACSARTKPRSPSVVVSLPDQTTTI
jgi:hypothetical protein